MIAELHVWKRWQRSVRRRIKASAELRRAYRRSRGQRQPNPAWNRLRAIPPLALAITLLSAEVPVSLVLNLLLLWTVMVTLGRAQQIVRSFHNPSVLSLFFGWPVTDDEVFAHQRKVILKSSLWLGVDWLVFGLVLALRMGDPAMAAVAPVLAIAQWATALGLALWLVRRWPRLPYAWSTTPFGIVLFLMIRAHTEHDDFSPYLEAVWRVLYLATPGGWLAQGWNNFTDGNPLGLSVMFGLGSAAVFTVVKGAQATRAIFNPEKLFGYQESPVTDTASLTPAQAAEVEINAEESDDDDTHSDESKTEVRWRETPAEIRGNVRTYAVEVLHTPAGHRLSRRGSIEHAISWFLTARQRALVDFMRPLGKPWLRRWAFAGVALSVALAVRFSAMPDLAVIPALVALCYALPVLGGRWLGFEALRTFQSQVGINAYVPASLGEIARLVLMINVLRCLAAFPLVLLAVRVGFFAGTPSLEWVLDTGLRLLGLVLAAQPIWVIGKFSGNTNDSSGRWYFLASLLIVLFIALIIGVMLAITLIMAESFLAAAGCLLALNVLTHLLLVFYALAWGRGWFDLIAKQK